MGDQIVINDPDCGHEIARAVRTHYNPGIHQSIARVRDGSCLAGAIYSQFTHESITIHQAVFVEHGLNRDLLFCAFDYPFNQLQVKRMFGFVPETNIDALHLNRHFGFREVARIDGFFRHGVACIVMRMDREDCRFLKIKPRRVLVRH